MNMNAFKRELAFAVTTGFVFVLPPLCWLVYMLYFHIEETGLFPPVRDFVGAGGILLMWFAGGVGACLIFRLLWWSVSTTIRQLRK